MLKAWLVKAIVALLCRKKIHKIALIKSRILKGYKTLNKQFKLGYRILRYN